ncbi:class I SAM-dependent methyltransferase [Variovorax sp. EL159]|uniref:class I SAM-dependent methyltransferase n=1 Tax=Variovorax sp. EL159 TaxID=1566270 RepID=UPI000891199D|nr:class I SAM-dependent methyltransferase [Variovorax sp. EL159]SCX73180.1 tRNA (cmo5U34)-methyltransferase [Variovorax sp. EL159]
MAQPDIDPNAHFNDPLSVSAYADKTRRLVPGWSDLQKMVALLVAERAPANANVLVVGAGGGVELKVFAQMHAQWRFVGVDPAKSMLELAEAELGPLIARAELHHGYVDTAPEGPFDAATCLLTMHFIAIDERGRTLKEIRRRLKPGAPFVMAHMSFPQAPAERALWLSRYVAFAVASGVDPESARNAASAIGSKLPLLGPDEEEAMLAEAGFTGAQLFYAGLAFRGWVAYA